MRDLTIDKYETSNTIGAKETIMTGSYGQTAEHIKDKIKVSDIFSSNNFFMTSLKEEFDAYKKENPKDNMSYETYQQRRLNSRAFNYDSIKDQQQNKEFWRDVGILVTVVGLGIATVVCPPAGAALAGTALTALTASVGVMEASSAVTGKDWLTQRKLDTNERWLRGLLGFVDVAPMAKGLHAFGNVTTGLKSGISTTTIKGASKVGLEEGGSRLKQADNLLAERAQNANRLSGKKFDNLSLNIEKKTPVENAPVIEKKSATFFDGLNLNNGTKVAGQAQNANRLSGEKLPAEGVSNLKYREGHDKHLIEVEDIVWKKGKGIVGGHNLDHFENAFKSNVWDLNEYIISKQPHPTVDGIYQIEYKLPAKDAAQNYVEGHYKKVGTPKTVYDPSKISDSQIIEWGKEAMENGVTNGRVRVGVASNGLKFTGYIDEVTGEIKNFHPSF